MSIADLIQWGRTAQRTGLLKLRSEDAREIDIVFRDGRIVFSSTNEKRNRWRGYLIYLGLTTDAEMEEAFQTKLVTGASVASILVREGKITYDQALATLNEKTMEDVCDVFLWPEGDFVFQPTAPAIKDSVRFTARSPSFWNGGFWFTRISQQPQTASGGRNASSGMRRKRRRKNAGPRPSRFCRDCWRRIPAVRI